jgi:hypothetical protein
MPEHQPPAKPPSTTSSSPTSSNKSSDANFRHTTPQRLAVFDPTRRHYSSKAWLNMINKMPWDSESTAIIDDTKGKKEGGEASDRNEMGVAGIKGKTDG